MGRVRYLRADCLCEAVKAIVGVCDEFNHIDTARVYCVSSVGARARVVARVHGLSTAWKVVGVGPAYLIEVVSERFTRLNPEGKLEVLIHELLHIPRTFSGALRPHGRHVNSMAVRRVMECLKGRGAGEAIRGILESCP